MRFWMENQNAQISSLRAAQTVIVGRMIIITYSMMPLIPPDDLEPASESERFGWLLYGTEAEMYEIHGGCGFSRKLLHLISQVTFYAARLQQEPQSEVTAMAIDFLLDELLKMRQWTSEFSAEWTNMPGDWTNSDVVFAKVAWKMAVEAKPVIEWVRAMKPGYILDRDEDMTLVTAEAWRFAVIIYLMCRLQRFVTLTDLDSS